MWLSSACFDIMFSVSTLLFPIWFIWPFSFLIFKTNLFTLFSFNSLVQPAHRWVQIPYQIFPSRTWSWWDRETWSCNMETKQKLSSCSAFVVSCPVLGHMIGVIYILICFYYLYLSWNIWLIVSILDNQSWANSIKLKIYMFQKLKTWSSRTW
jgi:hypothetical protein